MANVYHFLKDEPDHIKRVSDFVHDVNVDIDQCIRRHITTGDPVGISQITYYELRHAIADWLVIHPSKVVVIGSCRVGFTIKPRVRYSPFNPSSDIDVAVVSDQ